MINEDSMYFPDQLLSFVTSQRCCQDFCGSLRLSERMELAQHAAALGYSTRNYIKNGIETMKVYKRNCTHHVEPEFLRIQRQSAKELFILFHTHLQNDFIGRPQEMQMSPDFHSPGSNSCPTVLPIRFAQCSFSQSMANLSPINVVKLKSFEGLISYKDAVLNSVSRNRLIVVSGGSHFKKSTTLPMFLLENRAENHLHCKVICIELSQMMASYNCELLAKIMGEKVGEKIAYQVHGQSLISRNSNVIFTTVSFFLRFLMGQKPIDGLLHVSHIVVNDIHVRNAFGDLLLSELRAAMQCLPEIRVILLSNSRHNSIFLEYFNGGEEVQLDRIVGHECMIPRMPQTFYMEQIRQIVSENCSKPLAETNVPSEMCENDFNQKSMDQCLELYEKQGTDYALDAFLYMVTGEFASLNYRHSLTGATALNIAAKLGKSRHIRILLQLHADPFIVDKQNRNAMQRAFTSGNLECIDIFRAYCKIAKESCPDDNPAFFDSALVSDLICLITTQTGLPEGNILIFVPNYEELVRMNFALLRLKIIGKLPQHVAIRVLHDAMDKDEVINLTDGTSNGASIVVTTDIGETIPYFKEIKYVIDSARKSYRMYNPTADCVDNNFKWNSQESIYDRSLMINHTTGSSGMCFRLIPRLLYFQLPLINTPEMLTMPLDRICLTVKLLSPHTMIAEYLQRTLTPPPFINVHQTVENLKKIDVLDSLEDITWLGCRLIDLPIDCHLGKLIIFGVMLHCFDPILTIVSFLSQKDPLSLPKESECTKKNYANTMRHKVKKERKRLAGEFFSDHLVYLKLYQEWQNETPEENVEMPLTNEHDFVLKALLENVSLTRSNLVATLRAAQLIHNQGPLNMYFLNKNSTNWAMVKAALVGGLYPKICVVDASVYRIKSGRKKELVINPSSVLRNLSVEPLRVSVQCFPSPWIVFSSEINAVICNSLETCSLVSPLAIMMFAGPPKIFSENVVTYKASENFQRALELSSQSGSCFVSNFYIDEWIWFTMDATDTQLVLKTRQLFYSIYIHYLQNCVNMEKMRSSHSEGTQLPLLLEVLAKVLLSEDVQYGFTQPEDIGERPRAKQFKFLHAHNTTLGSCNTLLRTDLLPKKMEKQYFIVYCPEDADTDFGKSKLEWLHSIVFKNIETYLSPEKLTYVITYRRSPDQFRSVCLAFLESEKFKLRECFRNEIPIFELINICLNRKLLLPSFSERSIPFRVAAHVGEIVLDLFAYR